LYLNIREESTSKKGELRGKEESRDGMALYWAFSKSSQHSHHQANSVPVLVNTNDVVSLYCVEWILLWYLVASVLIMSYPTGTP
jgi:hypothetical protein